MIFCIRFDFALKKRGEIRCTKLRTRTSDSESFPSNCFVSSAPDFDYNMHREVHNPSALLLYASGSSNSIYLSIEHDSKHSRSRAHPEAIAIKTHSINM